MQSGHRLMFLIVIALGLLNFFFGEKIPAGGGFGWDGVLYAEMVRNLESMINLGQLSSYYSLRILPSAVVRGMLFLVNAQITDINIIRGFEIYNFLLLVVVCWVWKLLSDSFALSLAGRWVGFSGVFINFQCSKQAFYYPVLTDVTALFCGMLLLLFYVRKKPLLLFLTAIIGAFAWPVVSVFGAFLLIFLEGDLPSSAIAPKPSIFSMGGVTVPYLVKLGGLLVLIGSIYGYVLAPVLGLELACTAPSPVGVCTLEGLLTGAPSLFGLLVALAVLLGSRVFLMAAFACLLRARFFLMFLAVASIVIPVFVVGLIANPEIQNPGDWKVTLTYLLLPSVGKFFLSTLTLVLFWGPLVLLLIFYWREFCVEARKLGLGFVAVIFISLPLGFLGEPRMITLGWPFFVLGVVLVLERLEKKSSFKYVLGLFTVLYAQFWLVINVSPWLSLDYASLLEFPVQLYFMHYGLWMSWFSYFLQLSVVIISAVLLRNGIVGISADVEVGGCSGGKVVIK